MDLIKVISSLNSQKRLQIISHLADKDHNIKELYQKMKKDMKYRQYIHRHLEILVESNLVEKYYSKKDRSIIMYHLKREKLIIDLKNKKIS